jgi:uncharacterized protein (DUF3820 family)
MKPEARSALFLASAAVAAAAFAQPVAEGGRKFVTTLTGQAELDGGLLQADMDGTGIAHVTVNHGQGRVCWSLENLANLDTLVAAHIHEAPSNRSGGIRISFFHFGQAVDLEDCVEVGDTPFPFDRNRLRDILKNPENYYVNIHTTAFPSGAIRGQLSRGKQD